MCQVRCCSKKCKVGLLAEVLRCYQQARFNARAFGVIVDSYGAVEVCFASLFCLSFIVAFLSSFIPLVWLITLFLLACR